MTEIDGIKKESLRDNITLNQLAEITTTGISRTERPETFEQNKRVARRGDAVANVARKEYEKQVNKSVVSPLNAGEKEKLEIGNLAGFTDVSKSRQDD